MRPSIPDDVRLTTAIGGERFSLGGDDWLEQIRTVAADEPLESWMGYEVLSPAIRGGQATVHRCRRSDGRIVAVKRIHGGAGASASAKRRLMRELQIAEALHHPGIVAARTANAGDELLIESDWIAGTPLVDWCRDDGTGDPREEHSIAAVFIAVCDALSYAHQRGVIHRDLKPSNVLVDGDGRAHVLDFGLAGTLAEFAAHRTQVTLTEPMLGTPAYASPEQIAGDTGRIDERTDVYSLGVMLYEAVTGESPYPPGLSLGRLLRAVEDFEPARPRQKSATVSRESEAMILQALAKDPASRYASVGALRGDLERMIAGRPTQARPPGLWFDLRATARRHPKSAWAIATLSAVIAAAGSVGGLYAVRLARANRATVMAHNAAERVNQLLANLIGESAPPIDDDGAKLGSLLDRTARWMDDELSSDPWALARGHVSIGQLYAKAQHWAEADRHLSRAIDDYRKLGDPDRGTVAAALQQLGLAQAYLARPEAINTQRESLALATRLLGAGATTLANHHAALAETLVVVQGERARVEAGAEMDRALTILRSAEQRFPAWEAEILSAYGRALMHSGNAVAAVKLLEEASALFEEAQMPLETCPYRRACSKRLAEAYSTSGNEDAAARIRQRLAEARDRATSIPPYAQGD